MIDFNNLKTAFSDKSDTDLNRAYLLFKSISNPFVSKILTGLVQFSLKLHLPIKFIIKATVYKHFCGGTTIENSQNVINKLWKSHIGTILDYSAEGKQTEKDFNNVMEETIRTIKKSENEIGKIYKIYQDELLRLNCVDFGTLGQVVPRLEVPRRGALRSTSLRSAGGGTFLQGPPCNRFAMFPRVSPRKRRIKKGGHSICRMFETGSSRANRFDC